MRKCAPKHFSVDLALSYNAGGIGLSHVSVQIWILVGCSSRFDGAGGSRCQFYGSWNILRHDPDIPIVKVCPQLGSVVKRALDFREDVL